MAFQQVNSGSDIEEIVTRRVGFQSVGGNTKLQLPVQWPADSLPPTNTSLLAINSKQGIFAAAGPDSVVIARLNDIRAAFKADENKSQTIPYQPKITLKVPTLSHIAFTSDGTCLILTAQNGGLAVHEVNQLANGSTRPDFELPTNGIGIKVLAPNPNPDVAQYVALVLDNGHLMVANLREKEFVTVANGSQYFKSAVVSVSWSVKGKQMVASIQDGTLAQIDSNGALKAQIPRPPSLPDNYAISSLLWLGNDEFFLAATDPNATTEMPESAFYYLVADKDRTKFEYRKIMDPAFAGQNRLPIQHSIGRLRNWGQLDDALFITNSASSEVIFFLKSKVPVDSNKPQSANTYVYAMTELDTRRANLPMSISDEMNETGPLGLALDFSSTEKVWQPIPGDDVVENSPHPLPAACVLNQDGILSCWWFVNDDAVRQGVPCPGLVALEGSINNPSSQSVSNSPFTPSGQSTFGNAAAPAFAKPNPNPNPNPPAFASPSFTQATSSNNNNNNSPAFGAPSSLGQNSSPWNQSGSSKPSFGQPSFGSGSTLGQSKSPWASTTHNDSNGQPPASPFGSITQSSGASAFAKLGASSASPFGAVSGSNTFASSSSSKPLTGVSPFASSQATSGTSIFQSATSNNASSAFASPKPAAGSSPFASIGQTTTNSNPFASAGVGSTEKSKQSIFGQPASSVSHSGKQTTSFGSTVTLGSTTGGSTIDGKSTFSSLAPSRESSQATSIFSKAIEGSKDQHPGDAKPENDNKPQSKLFNQPFKVESTFKPGLTAKELDKDDGASSSKTSLSMGGLGLGGFGSKAPNTEDSFKKVSSPSVEITGDSKDQKTSLPQIKKSLLQNETPLPEPEPPQVTSKPMPSPATTAPSSGNQSINSLLSAETPDKIHKQVDKLSEALEEASGSDDGSELNENSSDSDKTPGRLNLQSPDDTIQSIVGSRSQIAQSPLEARSISALKSFPESIESSPAKSLSSAAPTPPVQSQGSRLFGEIPSRTPAGVPQPPFKFAPPQSDTSPRSPSPVRRSQVPSIRQPKPAQSAVVHKPLFVREDSPEIDDGFDDSKSLVSSLSDDADAKIRAILGQPVPETRDLQDFKAHQDYVGAVKLEGPAGDVEKVYRDINSMIDTLGLNSRHLEGWLKYHLNFTDLPRELSNFDEIEPYWTLDEQQRLVHIQEELNEHIDKEQVAELISAHTALSSLRHSLKQLKDDSKRIRLFLESKKKPEHDRRKREMPLDPATQNAQRSLRAALATHRALLADLEDKCTMAKAKLASRGKGSNMPTAEAVETTIRKMTAMVEQRSGDVDVLEMQIRKLGKLGLDPGLGDSPRRGRTFMLEDKEETLERHERKYSEEKTLGLVDLRMRRRIALHKLKESVQRKKIEAISA